MNSIQYDRNMCIADATAFLFLCYIPMEVSQTISIVLLRNVFVANNSFGITLKYINNK